jgi:hypothetical protein
MDARIETIVQLFVKKDKRERILSLAAKAKRRGDLRNDLLHDRRSLDPEVLAPLAQGADREAVAKALRAAGAKELAYCISEVIAADDRELALLDALSLVVGKAEDSLVFPLGSRVAYYENHEGEQYLLRRRP